MENSAVGRDDKYCHRFIHTRTHHVGMVFHEFIML